MTSPIKWLFFIFEIPVDTLSWKRYYRPILIKLLHQNGNVPKIFIGFDPVIRLSVRSFPVHMNSDEAKVGEAFPSFWERSQNEVGSG